MPQTAIRINNKNMVVITQQFDKTLAINAYTTDKDFFPLGNPLFSELEISEEEYHKNLRKDATKAGHFIPAYSTDPEWNPDYNPETAAEIEKIILEKNDTI